MTKEQFTAIGLTEEQATKAAEASQIELKEYVLKSEFDTVNTAKTTLEADIKIRDKDIEELKKASGTATELQEKYTKLEAKYKNEQVDSALDLAILSAKGKNTKAIKALVDKEKIKFNDDGTIEGLDLESIKKSDSYLFETVETKNEGTGNTGAVRPHTAADAKTQFENALFGN